ncbi:MAG: amidinotransferase [Gammaproteobacteria bacterium]|nr:amidinotransferase [Gammaproteobacteria bacterium]
MPESIRKTVQETQCADTVMMVRPVAFHANPLTRASNSFMDEDLGLNEQQQQQAALAEFEGLVSVLRKAGVRVLVFDDTRAPGTPDSVFPNNWVSFHADGTVVLYPMMAENRRTERRMDIIEALSSDEHYSVREIIDLSVHEQQQKFLESTGSLVLDRPNRIAYACLSARTDVDVLGDFAQRLDYEALTFDALDREGQPIYHTNVMMAQGDGFAVVCAESIRDKTQRTAVLNRLTSLAHEVVEISYTQMEHFAGNMLELKDQQGGKVLAMSSRAHDALDPGQREALGRHARLVHAPINVIEDSAGGSVRCMLAEGFLPRTRGQATQ